MSTLLDAAELRRALLASLDVLRARRASIDAANVYPVPDGDTGTNLVLTFEALARALEQVGEDLSEVVRATKTASLMGARGNSGVIMAQILRGLCEAMEGGPADPERLAQGFKRAVELAYESVLDPAEGTILTVARAAAEAAGGAHADVLAQLEAVEAAARDALRHTPEQLPVLAQAGVVDAGGMGLVAVLEAFAASLAGREVAPHEADPAERPHPAELCDGDPHGHAFEVQYMLEAPEETIPPLRQLLGTIGDSVAVVGGEGLWRVHVHTDDREKPVRFGEAIGVVSQVEVVSFAEQIEGARATTATAAKTGTPAERVPGQRGIPLVEQTPLTTLVAVAAGEGMHRLFAEVGAVVVDGGATMNPSVGELLAAIDGAPTDHVVVLPNNDNVYAAAIAAKAEAGKQTIVLRSADMAEGLAAALAFSAVSPADENERRLNVALGQVKTGQVAIANRSAATPSGEVEQGQALGFAEGSIVSPFGDANDPVVVACAVAQELIQPGDSVVTVLCGADAHEDERARLRTALAELLPAFEVQLLDGGQPVHRYLISVE